MLPDNFHLHLFVWFWVVLSFILLAFLLIVEASGYIINPKAKTLQPTGIIIVSSQPKGASLYLDDQLYDQTPAQIKDLRPGIYHLRIQLDQYQDWEKTIQLKAGQLIKEQAVLFLKEPKIEIVASPERDKVIPLFAREETSVEESIKANLPKGATDFAWNERGDTLLYRCGSEIRLYSQKASQTDDRVIARFVHEVQKVMWYPDFRHILFVVNHELRVIEIEGTNNTKLLPLPSANFVVLENTIYFQEGQEVKKVKVQ